MALELPKRVAENSGGFTGRTWLLPDVLAWWESSDERIFLLTGGPGTGKSMILAWLAGFGPSPADPEAEGQLARVRRAVKAAHFCQASSRNIAPQAFAESIANQLTASVTGFAAALTATLADRVQIAPTQLVGTVAAGGAATNLSIERIDLGALGDELSFDRALVQPLKKLYAGGHSEPMLLLVDALDEAFGYTGDRTLPELLSTLSDLPAQVRIFASTRPDPRVLTFFHGVKPLDLIAQSPPGVDDVTTYAAQRLGVALADAQRYEFAQRIATQAKGVFLYAAIVLDDLLPRLPEIPDLDAYPLPAGLSGLYHAFLRRELGTEQKGRRWFSTYKPLLGLIAVAQGEGFTAGQLGALVKRDVEEPLRACKQYLSGEWPDGPFRPFHRSFADFLLQDKDNRQYHIDPRAMHQRIVKHYGSKNRGDWSTCDDYGLRHLPLHLIEAGLDAQAVQLASAAFLIAKIRRFHDYRLVRDDLWNALIAAERADDPISEFRIGLVLEGLRARAANAPLAKLVPLYALAGEVERAVALVEIAPVEWKRRAAFRALVSTIAVLDPDRALGVAGRAGAADIQGECLTLVLKGYLRQHGWQAGRRSLLERILRLIALIHDHGWQSMLCWELHEALREQAATDAQRLFQDALRYARLESDPQRRCLALRTLAQASARTDPDLSAQIYRESLDALQLMEGSEWQAETFGALIAELASIDPGTALTRARGAEDGHCRVRGLLGVAPFLAVADEPEARTVLAEAEEGIASIGRGKAEGWGWRDKAIGLLKNVERKIPRIVSGEVRPPEIPPVETNLPLHVPEPLSPEEAEGLLRHVDDALVDPPDEAGLERMVVACLEHGQRGKALKLIEDGIRRLSRSSDREWQGRLAGLLIGEIASADPNKALALTRALAYGRGEAMGAVTVKVAQTDLPRAMALLKSTPPEDGSRTPDSLAQVLLEAARIGDLANLRLAVIGLLREAGAHAIERSAVTGDIAEILQDAARGDPVLRWTDLLCDTFAAASANLVARSAETATHFFRWILPRLSGDPDAIGRALSSVGRDDPALAIDLAREAVDAYAAKATLSEFARSKGIAEVVIGLSPYAPDVAEALLDASVHEPWSLAVGHSAVARAVASADRPRADQLLDRAGAEAQKAPFDWMKAEALLRMAADCTSWERRRAEELVESALAVVREHVAGEVLPGQSLAMAAEVLLTMGRLDRAESCLDEACDRMRSEKADSLELEAIAHTALRAPPALARRIAARLVKALAERGALWAGTSRLMQWSDSVARLLLHSSRDGAVSTAHALLKELALAEKTVEDVFIG